MHVTQTYAGDLSRVSLYVTGLVMDPAYVILGPQTREGN